MHRCVQKKSREHSMWPACESSHCSVSDLASPDRCQVHPQRLCAGTRRLCLIKHANAVLTHKVAMQLFKPAEPQVTPPCTIVQWIRQNAATYPEREALVCGDTRLNWAGLDSRISLAANSIIARGVRRGDNIAILAGNSTAYIEIFLGALRAGACVVPLSTMASATALAKMIQDSRCKLLFVSDNLRELLAPVIEQLDCLTAGGRIAIDFTLDGWENYQQILSVGTDRDPMVPIDFNDPF